MNWQTLLTPERLAILIPIVGVLVGGAIAITSMVIKHRERLAMIEQGMDPDAPKGKRIPLGGGAIAEQAPERREGM